MYRFLLRFAPSSWTNPLPALCAGILAGLEETGEHSALYSLTVKL